MRSDFKDTDICAGVMKDFYQKYTAQDFTLHFERNKRKFWKEKNLVHRT
jgi:hypothetical protein